MCFKMDSETESNKSHTESEEDDFGNYFLQPSSAPYNITEKVMEANVDLYNGNLHPNNEKAAKVKFREELVSFEPDLTDDDINSIESDHVEVLMDNCPLILEYKTTINNDVNIFSIDEEREKSPEEEVIIEDIESDCDEKIQKNVEPEKIYSTNVINTEAHNIVNSETTTTSSHTNNKRKKHARTNPTFFNTPEICCKSHCIDKLDFDLSMSIKRLDIHEKVKLPPLQLLQRKCCDQAKQTLNTKLPNYNGLRSEYGLSSRQLQNLEKQKITTRLREQMRCQLIEQYRQRRIHQNEKVFCQWLKEVSRRKSENKNYAKQKMENRHVQPKTTNGLSNKLNKGIKERSKSATECVPKMNMKKSRRPHTTHSCIYVEVPQCILEGGVSIGDLIITNSKMTKKLHILAV